MKKKLYVGNLSFETTESELTELFCQTGSVETVRIVMYRETGRSEGSAFAEMQGRRRYGDYRHERDAVCF